MTKTSHAVIPAEQATNLKKWRLPFWTEEPVWESEKVGTNIRRRSRVKVIQPDEPEAAPAAKAAESLPTEATVPSEEVEDIHLPTAEELETIRREAYNEGLEQGLVEGRNNGHQEGFAQGEQEGRAQGLEAGTNEGYQAGFAQGEAEGLAKAQANTNMIVTRLTRVMDTLNSRISERDQALPNILAKMVEALCKQVLQTELSQGSANIHALVQASLAQLPEGADNIHVWIGPDDAKHLQHSLAELGQSLNYSVDNSLPAGGCRIESSHSLVEYSSAEHLQQLVAKAQQQLLAALTDPETESSESVVDTAEPEALAETAITETVTPVDTSQPPSSDEAAALAADSEAQDEASHEAE